MRKPILLVLAAGVVLAAMLFLRALPDAQPVVEPAPPADALAAPGAPALTAETTLETAVADAAPSVEAARSEGVVPPQLAGPRRARVIGRCVDPEGRGIAHAAVRLTGDDEVWKDASDVPLVEERFNGRNWPMRRVATETDEAGRFALDVPVPGGSTWLHVSPVDDHDVFMTSFGGERRGNRPELAEGETDLGTLTLIATGRVEGFVRDEAANAVADAEVRLDGSFPGGYGRSASTDANGRYVVRAIPPGVYGIEALRNGWLTAKNPHVEVTAQAAVAGVDFTLKRAPILRGRIVDTQGQGLASIRVDAWPIGGNGQGAFTRTKDDGGFTLHLPQVEPYRIDLRVEGFEPVDAAAERQAYSPGTEDIEIKLRRIATTTLAVVDAGTGSAIETFAFVMCEGSPDQLGGNLGERVETHPGGTLILHAVPGRHALGVLAPGYVPWSGPVRHDDSSTKQTVRLERGATIRGRVIDGGAPVRTPEIRVAGALLKIDASMPDESEEERQFSENYHLDMPGFLAQRRTTKGAQDGTFRIDGLAPGTYELTALADAKAPLTRAAIRVEARQELDLGDLVLPIGGSVAGRVVPAPGQAPAGIAVELAWMDTSHKTTTGDDGRFAFQHVPPGTHEVQVELPDGRRALREPIEVVVEEGKVSEVVIDLAASRPCRLRVVVRVQGKPCERVSVDLCDPQNGRQIQQVGATGADGVLDTDVPSCGRARLVFSAAFMQGLGQAPQPFEFTPGGRVETEVDLPAGSVELVFPDDFKLPKLGHGSIRFEYEALPADTSHFLRWPHVQVEIASGTAVDRMASRTWSGTRWEIGLLAPGSCVVRIQVSEYDDPNDQGHARWSFYEGKTTVTAGAKAVCTLAKTERDH